MRSMALPLAMTGMLALAACQGMDSETGQRAGAGAAMGAAGGAVVGVFTGDVLGSAAVGAAAGATSGVVYDQYQKSRSK